METTGKCLALELLTTHEKVIISLLWAIGQLKMLKLFFNRTFLSYIYMTSVEYRADLLYNVGLTQNIKVVAGGGSECWNPFNSFMTNITMWLLAYGALFFILNFSQGIFEALNWILMQLIEESTSIYFYIPLPSTLLLCSLQPSTPEPIHKMWCSWKPPVSFSLQGATLHYIYRPCHGYVTQWAMGRAGSAC